jgi:hypothetical protein
VIVAAITSAPSVEAIEAGTLTMFMAGLAVVGIFAALTAVLRLLRGR